jgi:hypothetical protein
MLLVLMPAVRLRSMWDASMARRLLLGLECSVTVCHTRARGSSHAGFLSSVMIRLFWGIRPMDG